MKKIIYPKAFNYFLATCIAGVMFHASSQAQTICIGEAELLYTEDEMPIRYDGSLSTLQKDANTMYFFHSFGCRIEPGSNRRSRHSWHYGPPEDPLKVHHLSQTDEAFWDYNGYYQNREEEGIWILGMYRADNGDLLGITHSEVRDSPGRREDQVFSIGLGYSTDNGESWTYCGEIVRAGDPHTNVGGGAYIIRDGYLYVYYNDKDTSDRIKRPCVARARLKTVLKDASDHRVGKWYKYRDGRWDTPGLSDLAGTGIIPLAYGAEDVHSDAAFCKALGRYLLTVQTHGAGKLLLFSSADGLHWVQEAVVDVAEEGEMQPYSSFVDYDGPAEDCREVDESFYIYYPRKRLEDHEYDYMYRRLVTIE
jgi:hypothetical protein